MSELQFSWDPKKARTNERKHGVSFEEAESVFLDEEALQIDDPDHSDRETRFLLLGYSYRLRIVLVCHCLLEEEGVIRLISARKATKPERRQYNKQVRR